MASFGRPVASVTADVHANTKPFRREAEEGLKDPALDKASDDAAKKRGKTAGKEFTKSFGKSLNDEGGNKDLLVEMIREENADKAADKIANRFSKRMRDKFASGAMKIAPKFGVDEDVMRGVLDDMDAKFRKAGESGGEALTEGLDDGVNNRGAIRRITDSMGDNFKAGLAKQGYKVRESLANLFRITAVPKDVIAQKADEIAITLAQRLREGRVKVVKEAEETGEEVTEAVGRGIRRTAKKGVKEAGELGEDIARNLTSRIGRALATWNPKGGSDLTGRIFGKGSRNDFLNIVGSIVSGIGQVSEAIVKFPVNLIGYITDGIGQLGKALGSAGQGGGGGGMSALLAAVAGAAEVGWEAIAALPVVIGAAAVAMGVMLQLLGGIVAALSLLVAGVIAAASAISYGLIGAALAAAPALVALGAAFGVVTVAIQNMSDKQKKLLEPLGKQWEKVGKQVAKSFFKDLPTWISDATGLLKTFVGPTMNSIATTMGASVTKLFGTLSSDKFKPFLSAWGAAMTSISGSLSDALAKALPGIVAFFTPILPYAEKLATAIDQVAGRFSAWAASASGQNTIADFMQKAWAAASSLWDILVNVGSAISTVFSSGESTGQDFLTKLDEITAGWAAWVKTPEGQNQLKQWFSDAKKFADDLWGAIKTVGDTLKNLDTPENRKFASDFIKNVTDILASVNTALPQIQKAWGDFSTTILNLTPLFKDMGTAAAMSLQAVLTAIELVTSQLAGFFGLIGKIPGQQWASDLSTGFAQTTKDIDGAKQALTDLMDQDWTIDVKADADTEAAKKKADALQTQLNKLRAGTIPITADASPAIAAAHSAIDHLDSIPDATQTDINANPAAAILAATKATTYFDKIPDNTQTNINARDLASPVAQAATTAISKVPPAHDTLLDAKNDPLIKAASEATTAINNIPPSKTVIITGHVNFDGKIDQLERLAGMTASGAIVGMAGGGLLGQTGRVMRGPQIILAGEAGPEAVVPLDRPLSRVDPSVRTLSAIAQGKATDVPVGTGKNITVAPGAIIVTAPNANPLRVAEAVLDRLALSAI